jgi:hypothetical protein
LKNENSPIARYLPSISRRRNSARRDGGEIEDIVYRDTQIRDARHAVEFELIWT